VVPTHRYGVVGGALPLEWPHTLKTYWQSSAALTVSTWWMPGVDVDAVLSTVSTPPDTLVVTAPTAKLDGSDDTLAKLPLTARFSPRARLHGVRGTALAATHTDMASGQQTTPCSAPAAMAHSDDHV
jgi:hypothetical protein